MANYSATVVMNPSGSTTTRNLAVGDTLFITAYPGSGRTTTTPTTYISVTDCSSNVASDSSNPYNFTITNFTSSTYSAYVYFVDGDSNTTTYSATVSGSVSGGSSGPTAPTASSVTFNNPYSNNVTATVNLSASGSGGTLEYACEVDDTSPDNWQSSNQFTITRGSGTVYAQARRSSTAVSNIVNATRPSAITYSVTAPTSINEGSAGSCTVSTANVPNSTTLYWKVFPTGDFSTNIGSVSISGNSASFTVTPTADSTTEGAETATVVLYTDSARTNNVAQDTFTINDTSTAGTGGGSGGTGSGTGGVASNTYGLRIKSTTSTASEIFGVNVRTTNIQVYSTGTIAAGASRTHTGLGSDVTDSSKVQVIVDAGWFSSSGSFPVTRSTANGGSVTITNNRSSAASVTSLIIRIA